MCNSYVVLGLLGSLSFLVHPSLFLTTKKGMSLKSPSKEMEEKGGGGREGVLFIFNILLSFAARASVCTSSFKDGGSFFLL